MKPLRPSVMPAEAGIQGKRALVTLDPGVRRGDDLEER